MGRRGINHVIDVVVLVYNMYIYNLLGYGVLTKVQIPKGAYVCYYSGDRVTECGGNDHYVFEVQSKGVVSW